MKEITPDEKNTPRDSSITILAETVRKADTQAMVTNATDAFPDDSYAGQYWTGSGEVSGIAVKSILEPMYKPGTLYALSVQNNTLQQCVEAMEVNVDGTGHSIDLINSTDAEDEVEKTLLTDFFHEPYPGKSMIEIRRAIRRDIETTGNGYMEVIRTADDTIVMINSLDSNEIRLLRLDDPVVVNRPIIRGGKEIQVQVRARERRFVQNVNGKKIYFKEFNASRDLDRITGEWAKEATRLPVEKRASEIIHFLGNKEPKTPYGTPRWANQFPSVLGSRKAEEHNLEFFDGGGIPPLLILVEGGLVGDSVKKDLKAHFNGKGNKNRAAIVEIASASGTIDGPGKVGVKVERFGADQQKDAMFSTYDKETAEHVRTAFRLPPVFLGKSQDYSFATAYTSYMVAEAQVFFPERDEFDSKINCTIVKSLGIKKYKFRSLPMTIIDVTNQLKAIELITGSQFASAEQVVDTLNEITGLSIEFQEPPAAPEVPAPGPTGTGAGTNKPGYGVGTGTADLKVVKDESDLPEGYALIPERLAILANTWVDANGLVSSTTKADYDDNQRQELLMGLEDLNPHEARVVNQLIVSKCLTGIQHDMEGLTELCGCVTHTVN